MKIAILGLGKMGGNMVQRLLKGGHQVVAYDVDPARSAELAALGASPATTLDEVIAALAPRVLWAMVPSGKITGELIDKLSARLSRGDAIVDGGNSNFHDSMRRGKELGERGIHFLDAGTSGGIWGLKNGYCLMVGGSDAAYALVEPALKTLAPAGGGLLHTGPAGSGHYVKMVHNGIEYGLMAAYAEGFEIMKSAPFPRLDLPAIAKVWDSGSVVRSWLLQLLADALAKDPRLEKIEGYVEDSGEGRWTVQAAIDQDVPAPVITLSLLQRIASRQEASFSAKVCAALRNEFGGHAVKKS
ncbi:MAG: decarboxylating 6-phosphogluconate dehydrogenase [Myxococcales bacterium]